MYQLYQVLATNAFIAGKIHFKKWFFETSSFYMALGWIYGLWSLIGVFHLQIYDIQCTVI